MGNLAFSALMLLVGYQEEHPVVKNWVSVGDFRPCLRTMVVLIQYWVENHGFGALTLLVGHQEGHPVVKNWVVRCWRGYLCEVRCKWFACGPADATATSSLFFIRIQVCLTFLVLDYAAFSGKEAVKWASVCLAVQKCTQLESLGRGRFALCECFLVAYCVLVWSSVASHDNGFTSHKGRPTFWRSGRGLFQHSPTDRRRQHTKYVRGLLVGSRPSDHYFHSVCWFVVCLCGVFLSRLWSGFDQTKTLYVWV